MAETAEAMLSGQVILSLLITLLLAILTPLPGSYSRSIALPGSALSPSVFYVRRDPLHVKVSNLTSPKTQISHDFYSLRYCKPFSLNEFTQPQGFQDSVYAFHMREDQTCTVACRVMLDAEAAKNFGEKIIGDYRANMILSGIPVTERKAEGFRVGFKGTYDSGEEVYFIHNHLSFKVMYRSRNLTTDSAQIVGFEVDTYSINHEYEGPWNESPQLLTCNPSNNGVTQAFNKPLRTKSNAEVIFTYDVSFFEFDDKPRIHTVWFPGPDLII